MASLKIILKNNKINSNGEVPLYLRIIKDRKTKFISLGISIDPKHWNEKNNVIKKSHPNSARINNLLAQKISEAQNIVVELETNSKYVPPKTIKQAILGKSSTSFIEYANLYISSNETKLAYGTLKRFKSVIAKLKTYIGKNDLTFDDLTIYFLKMYEEYLRNELNNQTNTIGSNMKVLRRIINEAINDDIIPYEKNPFLKYKIKLSATTRDFLTEEELTNLENLTLVEGSQIYHHRNIYVFAAYAGGLRISDILFLKWSNYDGERILVQTQKTSSVVSIKLPLKAIEIIEAYKTDNVNSNHYIFPFLKNDEDYADKRTHLLKITSLTTATNNDLKILASMAGIKKNIHFHTSRHTWATRALRKGMRIEYVSKLMGHNSIKTTQIYAKIVNEDLDKAMDVFND